MHLVQFERDQLIGVSGGENPVSRTSSADQHFTVLCWMTFNQFCGCQHYEALVFASPSYITTNFEVRHETSAEFIYWPTFLGNIYLLKLCTTTLWYDQFGAGKL